MFRVSMDVSGLHATSSPLEIIDPVIEEEVIEEMKIETADAEMQSEKFSHEFEVQTDDVEPKKVYIEVPVKPPVFDEPFDPVDLLQIAHSLSATMLVNSSSSQKLEANSKKLRSMSPSNSTEWNKSTHLESPNARWKVAGDGLEVWTKGEGVINMLVPPPQGDIARIIDEAFTEALRSQCSVLNLRLHEVLMILGAINFTPATPSAHRALRVLMEKHTNPSEPRGRSTRRYEEVGAGDKPPGGDTEAPASEGGHRVTFSDGHSMADCTSSGAAFNSNVVLTTGDRWRLRKYDALASTSVTIAVPTIDAASLGTALSQFASENDIVSADRLSPQLTEAEATEALKNLMSLVEGPWRKIRPFLLVASGNDSVTLGSSTTSPPRAAKPTYNNNGWSHTVYRCQKRPAEWTYTCIHEFAQELQLPPTAINALRYCTGKEFLKIDPTRIDVDYGIRTSMMQSRFRVYHKLVCLIDKLWDRGHRPVDPLVTSTKYEQKSFDVFAAKTGVQDTFASKWGNLVASPFPSTGTKWGDVDNIDSLDADGTFLQTGDSANKQGIVPVEIAQVDTLIRDWMPLNRAYGWGLHLDTISRIAKEIGSMKGYLVKPEVFMFEGGHDGVKECRWICFDPTDGGDQARICEFLNSHETIPILRCFGDSGQDTGIQVPVSCVRSMLKHDIMLTDSYFDEGGFFVGATVQIAKESVLCKAYERFEWWDRPTPPILLKMAGQKGEIVSTAELQSHQRVGVRVGKIVDVIPIEALAANKAMPGAGGRGVGSALASSSRMSVGGPSRSQARAEARAEAQEARQRVGARAREAEAKAEARAKSKKVKKAKKRSARHSFDQFPTRPHKGRLEEGSKVEVNYRGQGKWYPGKIVRDRGDGTFDIAYDDGESEVRVSEDSIQLMGSGAGNDVADSSSSTLMRLKGLPSRHPVAMGIPFHRSYKSDQIAANSVSPSRDRSRSGSPSSRSSRSPSPIGLPFHRSFKGDQTLANQEANVVRTRSPSHPGRRASSPSLSLSPGLANAPTPAKHPSPAAHHQPHAPSPVHMAQSQESLEMPSSARQPVPITSVQFGGSRPTQPRPASASRIQKGFTNREPSPPRPTRFAVPAKSIPFQQLPTHQLLDPYGRDLFGRNPTNPSTSPDPTVRRPREEDARLGVSGRVAVADGGYVYVGSALDGDNLRDSPERARPVRSASPGSHPHTNRPYQQQQHQYQHWAS